MALDPATRIPAVNGLEASKQPPHNGAEKSLRAAEELTRKQLGKDARTSVAVTDGGIYRGFVIGETADYVVQQISKSSAIAHPKELLDGEARAGQKLSITYSNSHALVREVRESSNARRPWIGDSPSDVERYPDRGKHMVKHIRMYRRRAIRAFSARTPGDLRFSDSL